MMARVVVDSAKFVGIVTCGVCYRDSIACRNRGTRLSSLLIVSVIGQSARACHIGSSFGVASFVAATDVLSCRMRSRFASLSFVTQAFPALRISSCSSHTADLAWLLVVTCCTSGVIVSTTGSLSFYLCGYCGT